MAFRLALVVFLLAAFGQANAVETASSETIQKIDNPHASGWAESAERAAAMQRSFIKAAFWQAAPGRCEILSPNRAYVEEMLIDVGTIGAPGGAKYQRRVALVVGNSSYQSFSPLKNPANDANSMARALRALGFSVYRGLDLTAPELESCIMRFNQDLENEPADIALFFYAGHGAQLSDDDGERRNFMLATDADILASGEGKGFKQIDAVLNDMRDHSRQSVFFYDACRNDPLGDEKPSIADGVSIKRASLSRPGAAKIDVEKSATTDKAGIYIAYASAPNRPADDAYEEGADHSPFTQALLNHISTPGFSLKQAMSYVSNDVGELTDWNQTPWQNSSLTDEVKLNGELSQSELNARSIEFSTRSSKLRQEGFRNLAVAEALKGLPLIWLDDRRAKIFANTRRDLYKAMISEGGALTKENDGVNKAIYSPDGKLIVTTSTANHTINIWDANSLSQIGVLLGHADDITDIAFDGTGRILASASKDRTVKLWDTNSRRNIGSFAGHGAAVTAVDVNGSGIYVAAGAANGVIKVWDSRTRQLFTEFVASRNAILDITFNPTGQQLSVSDGNNKPLVFEIFTGEEAILSSLRPGGITATAYSPDGKYLVVAARGSLVIENILSRPDIEAHDGEITSIAFSSEPKVFATSSTDKSIKIWQIKNNKLNLKRTIYGHTAPVNSVYFNPQGDMIVSASDDRTVRTWAIQEKKPVNVFKDGGSKSSALTVSADGRYIAIGKADGSIRIWNVTTGKRHKSLKGHKKDPFSLSNNETPRTVLDMKFNDSGQYLVSGSANGTAKLWNVEFGKLKQSFVGSKGPIYAVDVGEDADRILTAYGDGSMDLWSSETGLVRSTFNGHTNKIFDVKFARDTDQFLSLSEDRTLKKWRISTAEQVSETNGIAVVNKAAISASEHRVVGRSQTNVTGVWDISSGNKIAILSNQAQFDGREAVSTDDRLALTRSDDLVATLWDIAAETSLFDFVQNEDNPIHALAIHPDNRQVIIGAEEQLKMWGIGGFGPELMTSAQDLLADDLRAEVERERIRHWEVDPAMLQ